MPEIDWKHIRELCETADDSRGSWRQVKRIYVHTAAKKGDTNIDKMRRYHVNVKGWADVGYHLLIPKDGSIQEGRRLYKRGAGVKGDNRNSLHICVAGHGDYEPWTDEQDATMITLLAAMCEEFELEPADVLGHREFWEKRGQMPGKTCPGKMVNMDTVRAGVESTMLSTLTLEGNLDYETEGLEVVS